MPDRSRPDGVQRPDLDALGHTYLDALVWPDEWATGTHRLLRANLGAILALLGRRPYDAAVRRRVGLNSDAPHEPIGRMAGFADLAGSAKVAGMQYDPNQLEARAARLKQAGRDRDAMAIYLHMADGDPSLDAGYLAMQIGSCCERLGDLHAARWWYGRAVEENPGIARYVEARQRLEHIGIAALLDGEASA